MAEATCITLLVHLVDHDNTTLGNMDDFSLNISDQLYCQLLVNLADHCSLLGPVKFSPRSKQSLDAFLRTNYRPGK